MSIQLFFPDQVTPEAVADYQRRNREFLAPFEPHRPEEYYTVPFWKHLLFQQLEEMQRGEAICFYIAEALGADRVIGSISLTGIIRGAFCSGYLGYRLDREYLGRGYMTEAVSQMVDYAFNAAGLHRVEANVMPRNKPSLRVLEKCGFHSEGVARAYLRINGVWEDHVHMVKLNDDWREM